MDIKEIAKTGDTALEAFMRIEPMIMTAASFIPTAKPVVAIVHPMIVTLAPFIERALEQIAAGNNGDAFGAMLQMIQHISVGQPNSPILSQTREERENQLAQNLGGNPAG
jgi:cobalamin synthase